MLTLSYGYKKPQNPDTGDIFYDALANDMQQLNDHAHNGTDSAPLASQTQNILAAAWSATAGLGGVYEQTITVPSGISYDIADIWFKLSTGELVYPSLTRVSATQYKIYTTNNALQYKAFYR